MAPGIVMSMSLHRTKDKLRLVAGYEDGYVKSWAIDEKAEEKEWSWDLLWSERKHIESGEQQYWALWVCVLLMLP